jgi:hypothetical protein
MEEAPENGKESSNSAHANGMNEWITVLCHVILAKVNLDCKAERMA